MVTIDHRPARNAVAGVGAAGATAIEPDRVRLPLPVTIYLLAVVVPFAFNAGSLYMTSVRLVVVLMVVPLLAMLLAGRFGRVLPTDLLLLLHLAVSMAAFGMNHPQGLIQHTGSSGAEFIGGYLIGRAFIRTRAQFLALCRWLSVAAMLMLPLALYESQTNRPLVIDFIRGLPGLSSFAPVNIEPRMGMFRSQVVFAHPIHFGLFCSVAFSLTFVALGGLISETRRYVSAAIIATCTFLALSSGAFLALLLQMLMIAWYMTFRKVEARWLLLLGVFVLAYIAIDILSTRPPLRVFMSYATFNAHTAFWRGIINEWSWMNVIGSAENNIPGSPWIGIGLNDWVRPDFVRSPSIDNFWMASTVRYGIPSTALLILGYGIAIWRIGRRDFRGDVTLENIRRAWIFTFSGLTFTMVTVHVWSNIYSFVFFMFGAGIWLLRAEKETAGRVQADAAAAPAPTHRYTRFPARPGPGPITGRRSA